MSWHQGGKGKGLVWSLSTYAHIHSGSVLVLAPKVGSQERSRCVSWGGNSNTLCSSWGKNSTDRSGNESLSVQEAGLTSDLPEENEASAG